MTTVNLSDVTQINTPNQDAQIRTYIGETKQQVVRAFQYIRPDIKRWEDIEKAGNKVEFYDPFEGSEATYTIKQYSDELIYITVTRKENLEEDQTAE